MFPIKPFEGKRKKGKILLLEEKLCHLKQKRCFFGLKKKNEKKGCISGNIVLGYEPSIPQEKCYEEKE